MNYTHNMPVTKTAKRALRGSVKKAAVNRLISSRLETAVRLAKKSKSREKVIQASSLADRAAKKQVIHSRKAARIKSQLAKLLTKTQPKVNQKASPKKKKK